MEKTTREILAEMNPAIFEGAVAPKVFDFSIEGTYKNVQEDGKTIRKTSWFGFPKQDTIKVDDITLKQGKFILCRLVETDIVRDNGNGKKVISGLGAPKTVNFFETNGGMLFEAISSAIGERNEAGVWRSYTEAELKEGKGNAKIGPVVKNRQDQVVPTILPNLQLEGAIISLAVPTYYIHQANAEGVEMKRKALKRNPATGAYYAEFATSSEINFFLPADRLTPGIIMQTAMAEYGRRVKGWETGVTVVPESGKIVKETVPSTEEEIQVEPVV